MLKNNILKKISSNKNYLIIAAILALILLAIFFLFQSNGNILFLIEYYSFGFFNGYSVSKLLWFFGLLVLLIGVPFVTTKYFSKQKAHSLKRQNKNTFWDFFSVAFFSAFSFSQIKKILLVLLVVLISLSTFSQFVFLWQNNLSVFDLAYTIYDDTYGVFTGTSLTHIHTFKPVLSPLAFLIKSGDFDLSQSIIAFMPDWIWVLYAIGGILILLFVYFAYKYSKYFFEKKPCDWFGAWIFTSSFYLISKSIIDGGLFTTEFLIGSLFFIWVLFGYKKKQSKILFVVMTFCVYVIDFCVRYLVVINSIKVLSESQLITLALKGIVSVSGVLFFVGAIGLLIYFLTLKKLSWKKLSITFGVFFVFVLISFFVFSNAFTFYGIQKAVTEESANSLSAKIEKGTLLGFIPYALKSNAPIKVIDSNNEIFLGRTLRDTTISELSVWPKNIKSVNYFYVWKKMCDFPTSLKNIFLKINSKENLKENLGVNSNNGLLPLESSSSIYLIDEKKLINGDYKLTLLHSECVVDVRALLIEYLKKRGLKKFILYG
jgi:hypothetical protein